MAENKKSMSMFSYMMKEDGYKPSDSNDLLARSLEILKDIYDEGECRYDHHGSCQTHGWINMGNCPCPHMRARALFEEIEAG